MPGAGTPTARKAAVDSSQNLAALIAAENASARDARDAVADILAREGFTLNCFEDIDALIATDASVAPSVILLWLAEPISAPPRPLELLAKSFDQIPVVVVCASIQRREVRTALACGALGVVVRDTLDSTLAPCLRAVRAGQICVPRGHWREVEPPVLSTREKQILGLVVMGYMNSQIAERLFLAESTVKSHLSSAFSKLGVRSRNEAVDLILNPERGLGMGILALGGEPVQTEPVAVP